MIYLKDMSSHAFKESNKKIKVKFSSKVDIWVVTGNDKFNRKKTSKKTSSAVKLNYRMEKNTSIN